MRKNVDSKVCQIPLKLRVTQTESLLVKYKETQLASSKRKTKQDQLNKVNMAILEELKENLQDDEDSYFMKSLISQLKWLNPRSKALPNVKYKFLYDEDFRTAFEPH